MLSDALQTESHKVGELELRSSRNSVDLDSAARKEQDLRVQCAVYEKQVSVCTEQTASLQDKCATLEDTLEQVRCALGCKDIEVTALQAKVVVLECAVAEGNSALQVLSDRSQGHEVRAEALRKEVEHVRSVLGVCEEDKRVLQVRCVELEGVVEALRDEVKVSVGRAEGLSDELKKQREVLAYINRISAENEAALRRQSGLQTVGTAAAAVGVVTGGNK